MRAIYHPEPSEGSPWGRNEEAEAWGQALSVQNPKSLTPPHPLSSILNKTPFIDSAFPLSL